MSATILKTDLADKEDHAQDKRLQLVEELQQSLLQGNEETTRKLIEEISREEQASLFNEIGRLTRNLHDALGSASMSNSINNILELNMGDARDRLNYIVQKTEESANSTISAMEDILPVVDDINDSATKMQKDWKRFTKREMQADEFRQLSKEIEIYFSELETNTGKVHKQLNEVILAQGYQDLVGQVVKQITTIVEDVESGLVNIIKNSGRSEELTSQHQKAEHSKPTAHGPQVDTSAKDVMANQDEVDELLSSLGF